MRAFRQYTAGRFVGGGSSLSELLSLRSVGILLESGLSRRTYGCPFSIASRNTTKSRYGNPSFYFWRFLSFGKNAAIEEDFCFIYSFE